MAHRLSTYDANHDHIATHYYDGRSEAFDAFDRALHGDNPRVVWVELTEDGVNRVHRIERAEEPHGGDVDQAAGADGQAGERADDAAAVGGAGEPAPAAPAVAPTDTVVSVQPKRGGRTSNRAVSTADR